MERELTVLSSLIQLSIVGNDGSSSAFQLCLHSNFLIKSALIKKRSLKMLRQLDAAKFSNSAVETRLSFSEKVYGYFWTSLRYEVVGAKIPLKKCQSEE